MSIFANFLHVPKLDCAFSALCLTLLLQTYNSVLFDVMYDFWCPPFIVFTHNCLFFFQTVLSLWIIYNIMVLTQNESYLSFRNPSAQLVFLNLIFSTFISAGLLLDFLQPYFPVSISNFYSFWFAICQPFQYYCLPGLYIDSIKPFRSFRAAMCIAKSFSNRVVSMFESQNLYHQVSTFLFLW